MKTTIDIPDAELRDVVRHTGAATKREAVVAAIAGYNRRRRVAAVVKEFGTMKQFMTRNDLQRLRRDRQTTWRPSSIPQRRARRFGPEAMPTRRAVEEATRDGDAGTALGD